jgi:DNA-directed RNA polymerase specialized sigma24 family protein
LVSASDVVAVLTAHVDRVHDAARRLGCSGDEAFEVTRTASAALIDDLAQQPETVVDLVGGLYARGRATASTVRRGGGAPVSYEGTGTLLDEAETAEVEAALFDLPERRRLGVLLVDAYALTVDQAAVGLGLDAAETARTVALGRLGLVADVDGGAAPSLLGHDVAVGDLGQLADGSAPAGGRFATLRRHVSSCAVCAEVLAAETRGRALAASLPIHAPSDDDRADLLARASSRAATVLPTWEEVQAELAGERNDPPLIPAFVIVLALAVALVLGVGLGVLLHGGNSDGTASVSTTNPAASPTEPPTPTPTSPSTLATPTVTTSSAATLSTSAAPTTSAPVAPTTTTTPAAAITLRPSSGPSGSTIMLRGSGFPPSTLVTVTYSHHHGGENDQTATVDSRGRFSATITANDPSQPAGLLSPPVDNSGPHTVTATDGTAQATATFTQTT